MTDVQMKVAQKSDLFLGALVGLAVTFLAALMGHAAIVVIPTLGATALVISWFWKNRIFRGFALTLATLTLAVVGVYFAAYLPYMLASSLGLVLGP